MFAMQQSVRCRSTKPPHQLLRHRHTLQGRSSRAKQQVVASADYETLKAFQVVKASTGERLGIDSLWQAASGRRVVLPFLSHFGDLTSWEFAQKLLKVMPRLEAAGVQVIVIGLGSLENAVEFSRQLSFPLELLHADPDGAVYKALGFVPGFGEDLNINPYLKLLPMLMGIGSPGTVQEVLRGYVGDRSSKQVFSSPTPFDVLGRDYQRPFELATLRLSNMIGILPRWGDLSPPKTELLTQQGGVLVLDGEQLVWKHVDSGILKYADVEEMLAAAIPPAALQA